MSTTSYGLRPSRALLIYFLAELYLRVPGAPHFATCFLGPSIGHGFGLWTLVSYFVTLVVRVGFVRINLGICLPRGAPVTRVSLTLKSTISSSSLLWSFSTSWSWSRSWLCSSYSSSFISSPAFPLSFVSLLMRITSLYSAFTVELTAIELRVRRFHLLLDTWPFSLLLYFAFVFAFVCTFVLFASLLLADTSAAAALAFFSAVISCVAFSGVVFENEARWFDRLTGDQVIV